MVRARHLVDWRSKNLAYLGRICARQRATEDSEVLREDEYGAAMNCTLPSDDTIASGLSEQGK